MSWRSIQLGNQLCDQDKLIIDLFKDQSVKCIGADIEFTQHLCIDNNSKNLILILNNAMWISDLYKILHKNLTTPITNFYLGVNRYKILGNDTNLEYNISEQHGNNIIQVIDKIITQLNYSIVKKGTHDNDQGQHFNFVQPLTWVHGSYVTN